MKYWSSFFLAAFCQIVLAQPEDRLVTPIDGRMTVVFRGSVNPRIEKADPQGPVDPDMPLRGLGLRFKPSASQSAALEKLLEDQQDASSPQYHAWLTPEEYADRFGLSPSDLAKVTEWLQSQGFQVDSIARSRTHITFSATAGQVRDTFKTELHRFTLSGKTHFANVSEIQLPADLEPLIYKIRGLDDFRMESRSRPRPLNNTPTGRHVLLPGDLATIYDITPLYNRGITGKGQKIVVAGQSRFNMVDVQNFRSNYGLPKNDPRLILVPNYPDPGLNDDVGETILDLEWSGAIAPEATILYVYSPNVELSAEYAIDQNLAPVISFSYGVCEKAATSVPGSLDFYRSMAQQANAQGITWVASAGDAGPADCELQQVDPVGVSGIAVDLPASMPEVTGLGGTEFNEGNGNYWYATNTSGTLASARSYIPETAWNDTAIDRGLVATGGGASIFFTKPAWQTGPGVPAKNARHVPDISFTASWDHDPYVTVMDGDTYASGGTSAAAPVFAGVLALLNQHLVSGGFQTKAGLGNVNPKLYQMAQTTTGVFHDITSGSNISPCKIGTPDCTTGQYGFMTTPGYDQVTGLGSLDVANFIDRWAGSPSTPSAISTTVTVAANPASVTVNASTVLTATVRPASGTTAPSGSVAFSAGRTALGTANLNSSGVASITVNGSTLAVGSNAITASYSGATAFGPSSGTTNVTVNVPTSASAVVPSVTPSPVYQQALDEDGYAWFYTFRLTEISGTSTTITAFSIDGFDHTADIRAWFGSTTLAAQGTLSASLRSRGLSVPANRIFSISGVDSTGQRWTQQLTVPFLAEQISASMALSSSPGTVIQNPNPACSADHPFYQQVNLQELNGYEVRLTKFFAASLDLTDQIPKWFGSLRLAPLGTLHADICWKLDSVPTTLSYEVDGVDSGGHTIKTTMTVDFRGPAQIPGTLTTSKSSIAVAAAPSGSASASLTVTVPAGESWSVSKFPANQKTSWLVVSPQSGKGAQQVNLVASAAGLANGVYTATLVFESVHSIPQFINVPVTFTIGGSNGTVITGLQNSASFKQIFAPGMIMSVYGTALANTTLSAQSAPLPLALGGVSATVNGVAAPLWFVSSTLINLQIPYETPVGPAIVAVNNNGQVNSFSFQVSATAPGIFNSSGALVPASTAYRGSVASLYLTGDGELSPMTDTGAPPPPNTPIAQLPKPRAPLTVSVGGIQAEVVFAGNPWLVGVTQVNFVVPQNAPLGAQQVIVTVGGASSAPQMLTVQ